MYHSISFAFHFSDSELVLLDDPLSAVDANVAQHLFKQCIKTLLRGRTVILVTHLVQVCSDRWISNTMIVPIHVHVLTLVVKYQNKGKYM